MEASAKYTHEQLMQRYGFTGLRVAQWEHNAYSTGAPAIRSHTVHPDAYRRAAPAVYRYVIPASPKVPEVTDDEESEPEAETETSVEGSPSPAATTSLEGILKGFDAQEVQSQIKDETTTLAAVSSPTENPKPKRKTKSSVWAAWTKPSSRPRKATKTATASVVDVPVTAPPVDSASAAAAAPAVVDAVSGTAEETKDSNDAAVVVEASEAVSNEVPDASDPLASIVDPLTNLDDILAGLNSPTVGSLPVVDLDDVVDVAPAAPISSEDVPAADSPDIDSANTTGVEQEAESAPDAVVDATVSIEVDDDAAASKPSPTDPAVNQDDPSSLPDTAHDGANTIEKAGDSGTVRQTDAAEAVDPLADLLTDTVPEVASSPSAPDSAATTIDLDALLASAEANEAAEHDISPDSPDTSSIITATSEDKHVSFAPGTPDGKETKRKKKSVKKRRPSMTNVEPPATKPDDVTGETTSTIVPEGETIKDLGTTEDKTATSTASAAPSKKAVKSKSSSKPAGLFVGGLLAFGAKPKSKSSSKKKKAAEQSDDKETTASASAVGLGIDIVPEDTESAELLTGGINGGATAQEDILEAVEAAPDQKLQTAANDLIEAGLATVIDAADAEVVDIDSDPAGDVLDLGPSNSAPIESELDSAEVLPTDTVVSDEGTADMEEGSSTQVADAPEDSVPTDLSIPEPEVVAETEVEPTDPAPEEVIVEDNVAVLLSDEPTVSAPDTSKNPLDAELVIEAQPSVLDADALPAVEEHIPSAAMAEANEESEVAADLMLSPIDSGVVLHKEDESHSVNVEEVPVSTELPTSVDTQAHMADDQSSSEIDTVHQGQIAIADDPLVDPVQGDSQVDDALLTNGDAPLSDDSAEPVDPLACLDDILDLALTENSTAEVSDAQVLATEPVDATQESAIGALAAPENLVLVDESTAPQAAESDSFLVSIGALDAAEKNNITDDVQDTLAADLIDPGLKIEALKEAPALTEEPLDLDATVGPAAKSVSVEESSPDIVNTKEPDQTDIAPVVPEIIAMEPEEPQPHCPDERAAPALDGVTGDPTDLMFGEISSAEPETNPMATMQPPPVDPDLPEQSSTQKTEGYSPDSTLDNAQAVEVESPSEKTMHQTDTAMPYIAETVVPVVGSAQGVAPSSPTESRSGRRHRSDRPRSSRKTTEDMTRDRRPATDDADRRRRREVRRSDEQDRARSDTQAEEDEDRRLRREAKRAAKKAQDAEEAARIARQEADAIAARDAEARRRRREQKPVESKAVDKSRPTVAANLLAGLLGSSLSVQGSTTGRLRSDPVRRDVTGPSSKKTDTTRREADNGRSTSYRDDRPRDRTSAKEDRPREPERRKVADSTDGRSRTSGGESRDARPQISSRTESLADTEERRQRSSRTDATRVRRRRTSDRSDVRPVVESRGLMGSLFGR